MWVPWLINIQVNICQKCSFLPQLTHNMTTDCLLNYEFSKGKFQAQNMLCRQIVFCFEIQNTFMYPTCSWHILSLEFSCMYWSCNSMNNLLSYCGLVDARISATEKDLPVLKQNFNTIFPRIFTQWEQYHRLRTE